MANDTKEDTDAAHGGGALVVKLLSVFAVVRPDEVFSVLLLTLDGILLLASYYFLKDIL